MEGLLSHQLEYFMIAYQKANIHEAARAIPLTYPGIKKALARLEADVGQMLFVQHENGILERTRAADTLYDMAIVWMQNISQFEQLFADQAEVAQAIVSICAAECATGFLGYNIVKEFSARHPSLKLVIDEYPEVKVDTKLENGIYALGITTIPFSSKLITRPLVSNGCLAFVNLENPLSTNKTLRMADLDGQSIMMPDFRIKAHRYFMEFFETHNIQPSSVTFCANPVSPYAYASDNHGIGIGIAGAPGFTALKRENDGVTCLTIEDGYTYTLGLSRRPGRTLSEHETLAFDFLLDYIKNIQCTN